MAQLKELSCNDLPLLLNELSPIRNKYIYIGIQLGVNNDKIKDIEFQFNPGDRLYEILAYRLKKKPPLTWHDIIKALRSNSVDETTTASDIEDKYIHPNSYKSATDQFLSYVRAQYRLQKVQRYDCCTPKKIVNLVSIDRESVISKEEATDMANTKECHGDVDVIIKKKKHINFEDVVKGLPETDKGGIIIVEGAPGVGKSTFAWEFCRRWERGEIAQNYQLVLLVRLRDSTAKTLRDLIHHPQEAVIKAVEKQLVTSNGKNTLFILEGYDELLDTYRYNSSLYVQMIHGDLLPNATILVTSRPCATRSLHHDCKNRIFRYIEILGFYEFDQFVRSVKAYYRSQEVLTDARFIVWPLTPTKKFINLVSIDRESVVSKEEADAVTKAMVLCGDVDVLMKKKKSIDFEDVVKGLPKTDKGGIIIVEGAPGVGKSTFAWEFCRRWERGEIAQNYQLVLLLKLRDNKMSKAKNIRDLIHHAQKAVIKAVVQHLVDSHGANTLFILEGYDELPGTYRSNSSLYVQMIHGELLPNATILVTSRPWATRDLHYSCKKRIFRYIEILGFSSSQITEYIQSTLEEKVIEDFLKYLDNRPHIRICMYIPLNCTIVVNVYHDRKASNCSLPQTSTELYKALILTLLVRHVYRDKNNEEIRKTIESLKDLSPEVRTQFYKICEIAYNGIVTNDGQVKIVFNDLPLDFNDLGLMDSVTELFTTKGEVRSYNFLHLTFQEYLAAVHISEMSVEEQLKHFENKDRYRVVLKFLGGITKFEGIPICRIQYLIKDYNYYIQFNDDYSNVVVTKLHINWMFEAQSMSLILNTLGAETTVLYEEGDEAALPLDYYSLGYCIVHSKSQWILSFESKQTDNDLQLKRKEEIEMLVNGANTTMETAARVVGLAGKKRYDSQRSSLVISAHLLNTLFTRMKHVMCLKELWLDVKTDCRSIEWPDLSQMEILHLRIDKSLSGELETLLSSPSLRTLDISSNIFENDMHLNRKDCIVIGKLLSSSVILCRNLTISDNDSNKQNKYKIEKSNAKKKDPLLVEMNIHKLSGNEQLGHVIAHSNSQWALEIDNMHNGEIDLATTREEMKLFVEAATSNMDKGTQIVKLKIKRDVNSLNRLFTDMNHMLSLEDLSLELPVDCSCIAWPDLSRLRVLELRISGSGEKNLKLSSLLPPLTLDSLNIISALYDEWRLCADDCITIGQILSSSSCPKNVHIQLSKEVFVTSDVQTERKSLLPKKTYSCTVSQSYTKQTAYLGYCISHSSCQWILTFDNKNRNNLKTLTAGISRVLETKASVVVLRGRTYDINERKLVHLPLLISCDDLNALFTNMSLKHMLSLEELSLELPVDCSCIAWPDLSRLQVLHLGISGERNWKLSFLLSRLTLDTLKITIPVSKWRLSIEDCIAIGQTLSSSKRIHIEVSGEFCVTSEIHQPMHTTKRNVDMSQLRTEMTIFCNNNQDNLGYLLHYSSCNWILTIENNYSKRLVVGDSSTCHYNARVVGLRGGQHIKQYNFSPVKFVHQPLSLSAEDLKHLFTDLKHLLNLKELSLELPVDCSCIDWPDLSRSRLRVLELEINAEGRRELSRLFSHETLDSLKITGTCPLCLEDSSVVGKLLLPFKYPEKVHFAKENRYYITSDVRVDKTTKQFLDWENKKTNGLLLEIVILNFENENEHYNYIGQLIAYSSCKWILTFNSEGDNNCFKILTTAITSRPETTAKIVSIRGCERLSVQNCYYTLQPIKFNNNEGLKNLFTDMKHMLSLEELALELPVDCSCIKWQDFSQLRVLKLGIRGKQNWKLSSLLRHLKLLDSLEIRGTNSNPAPTLQLQDCIEIGKMLSPSRCPKRLLIKIGQNITISHPQETEIPCDEVNKENNFSLLVEMKVKNNTDQRYLGYCIAHSSCHWMLTLINEHIDIETLIEGACFEHETSARVVKLKQIYSPNGSKPTFLPLSENAMARDLNSLFSGMKHVLSLEVLILELPIDCSYIDWPDLSRLRILALGICGKRNWNLNSLWPHLTVGMCALLIEDFNVQKAALLEKDCIAVGELLSTSRCPTRVGILHYAIINSNNDSEQTLCNQEIVIYNQTSYIEYMGHCVAYSSCKWVLAFENQKWNININTFGVGAKSRSDTHARIVGLTGVCTDKDCYVQQPLLVSANYLNDFFKDLKHMLSLEELSLELPVNCSCIAWPDLSRLRELELKISGESYWELSSLLPRLTLDTLIITGSVSSSECVLCLEDSIAVGELLCTSRYPKQMAVEIKDKYCIARRESQFPKISLLVEMVIYDSKNQDNLGDIITHSNCDWIVTVENGSRDINYDTFAAVASSEHDTSSRVVHLMGGEYDKVNDDKKETSEPEFYSKPLSLSAQALNALFTNMNHMLSLEKLSLELPVDCSCIAWPDLSRLRVLKLKISGERNWELSSLLPRLTLDTLNITGSVSSSECVLCLEDSIAVGELLCTSRCPNEMTVEIKDKYDIARHESQFPKISLLVEMVIYDSKNQDNLGDIITHSNCDWIVTVENGSRDINYDTFAAVASSAHDTSSRVVHLRGGKYDKVNDDKKETSAPEFYFKPLSLSAEALNALFTNMNHMLSLEELSLELPLDCSCIAWPDLSRLQVLELGISGKRNWKFSSLLPHLTLDTLNITAIDNSPETALCEEDNIVVKELLSTSRSPDNVVIFQQLVKF